MTPVLLALALIGQVGISPLGPHDRVRVGKKKGFAISDAEFSFTVKGPKKLGLKLYGDADLHGRSIWLDIERNDQWVSENTLALVDRGKGPKKYRAQADLELSVPAGDQTYRMRASDSIVVVFARAGRGGALLAAEETPLGDVKPKTPPSGESGGEPSGEPGDQPKEEPGDEPDDEPGDEPDDEPDDEPGDEPPPAPSGSGVVVGHGGGFGYDGGFYLRTADERFELKQNGRLQLRHSFATTMPPDPATQNTAFTIPRAYIILRGRAFDLIRFKTEINFGEGFVYLKDAFADVTLLDDSLVMRVGQWKRPFSRQQINSSGKVQLVDRALTNATFDIGRDIGVGLHNRYEESPELEWVFAVVNGESIASTLTGNPLINAPITNVPLVAQYGVVGRFGYNYGGIDGYNEPDFDGGPLRFGVGASAMWQFDSDNSGDAAIAAELDFILKVAHLSANGAFYLATGQSGEGRMEQALAAMGFHVQTGFLIADFVEPTARFAMFMPEGGVDLQEVTAGAAFYIYGHNVKAQADFAILLPDFEFDFAVLRSRLQFQMAF